MQPMIDLETNGVSDVEKFIKSHWEETVRFSPQDNGTVVGLPHPYVVPCRKDSFQELYYWDTYFACLGLIHSGRADLVIANLRNFLHLINRFGFIPNGSRTYYLDRSQPPYFAALVKLMMENGLDEELTAEAIRGIKVEYDFWNNRRNTVVGLARHGHHATPDEAREFFLEIKDRAQLDATGEEEQRQQTSHTLAEAESGWDFNPRFEHRCEDFCPVDLNSSLFVYEELLAGVTTGEEQQMWLQRAAQRRERLTEFCWNPEAGAFFDYDYVNGRQSTILAASTFHPLWTGIATAKQAALVKEKALPRLELEFAIVTCEAGPRKKTCQWDHPNAWPCLQIIAYRGLARYGYTEDARRIAWKYVSTVCRGFAATGDLWEKYNAQDGSTHTRGEVGYVAPAMMGWTAGAFLDAVAYLRESA